MTLKFSRQVFEKSPNIKDHEHSPVIAELFHADGRTDGLSLWSQYSLFREFYIYGSVHRKSILVRSNKMQQYVGIYLLQNYSTYFGCRSHPSSGVHKTVTAASGIGHSICATTFLQRDLWPRWRKVVAQILWPVPEAAVTVLCTHDNGCDGHLKYVE